MRWEDDVCARQIGDGKVVKRIRAGRSGWIVEVESGFCSGEVEEEEEAETGKTTINANTTKERETKRPLKINISIRGVK